MTSAQARIYEAADLEVFNLLADWVYVRDLSPATGPQNYWANENMLETFNMTTQAEFLAQDLRAITSPAMMQWSQEVCEQVQVRGERTVKRRNIYPTGKPPLVIDLHYCPIHFRAEGATEVKVLALVHGKRVNLNDDALREANRAAVLVNFTKDTVLLLPGAGTTEGKAADPAQSERSSFAGDTGQAQRPAVFTNLPARRSYSKRENPTVGAGGHLAAGQTQQDQITLARVLQTCRFGSEGERQALQASILRLGLRDPPIVIEGHTPAALSEGGSGPEIYPNLPKHRKIRFAPVTDPVTGVLSVMVTEHDVSDLKSALEKLRASREQSSKLLYSMLPDDVADSLCAGQRVQPRIHPTVSIFFADIVGFTTICSRSTPREICEMLDELYTVMDCVSSAFDVYKIETVGDSYMAAGGLFADTDERRRRDACRTVDMAVAMITAARHVRVPSPSCLSPASQPSTPTDTHCVPRRLPPPPPLVSTIDGGGGRSSSFSSLDSSSSRRQPCPGGPGGAEGATGAPEWGGDRQQEALRGEGAGGRHGEYHDTLQLRVGIHTGEVASGVVGTHLPRFKLFGEDVCTAARLESTGAADRVHCSCHTAAILREQGYTVESRGQLALKGLGDMETCWVVALPEGVQASVDAAVEKSREQLQLLRDYKDLNVPYEGESPQRIRSWRGAHEFQVALPASPPSDSFLGGDQFLQVDGSPDGADVDDRRRAVQGSGAGYASSSSSEEMQDPVGGYAWERWLWSFGLKRQGKHHASRE